MRNRTLLVGTLTACLALAGSAGALEPKISDGIRWVSGGVGTEEREALESMSRDFSLKAIFAVEQHEAFLSDVAFEIAKKGGARVVEGKTNGPWLYVDLPAGSYEISATTEHGETQRQSFTVADSGQANVSFHFSRASASR